MVGTIVEIGYETAMRRSEIVKLQVKHLHLEQRLLSVVNGKEGDRSVPLGAISTPGSTGQLIEGHHKAYETLLLRNEPILVSNGEFRFGDSVSIVGRDKKQVASVGMLSADPDQESGIRVVATSPTGDTYLHVTRLGSQSEIIGSSWYDRAIQDPLLIGISTLLAALLALLELMSRLPRIEPK